MSSRNDLLFNNPRRSGSDLMHSIWDLVVSGILIMATRTSYFLQYLEYARYCVPVGVGSHSRLVLFDSVLRRAAPS